MDLAVTRHEAKRARSVVRPEPRVRGGGDELRELAETFRQTVERLSDLVHQLEAAHQETLRAEAEKKRFYREVIRAVTQGKFELVDEEELPVEAEAPLAQLSVRTGPDYAAARTAIRAEAIRAGLSEDRADELVLAAGEAITNATKHANGGRCEIFGRPDGIAVRIRDLGSGIHPNDLASAILVPGFSTKVSLGMGYTLMLRLTDRVWLATSPKGTTVLLEKRVEAPQDPGLAGQLLSRF